MPQIGWFEILIIVVLAVLIVGPMDVPIVLKKIGGWIGSIKRYFNEIQKDLTNLETDVKEEISLEDNYSKKTKDNNKKDE